MILGKDGILKAKDLPFKDVDVSKWLGKGATIRLRGWTAKGKELGRAGSKPGACNYKGNTL